MIALFLASKVFRVVVAVILALVCALMLSHITEIETFFGVETKASLKEKTVQQAAVIGVLADTNKENDKTLGKVIESGKADIAAVVDASKLKDKVANKVSKINKKRITSLGELKHKPGVFNVEVETSAIQMSGVWKVYCALDDSNDNDCAAYAKGDLKWYD